jgi:phenylacetate-coenzyme A ligase PaaK-like adenylate-forming protein
VLRTVRILLSRAYYGQRARAGRIASDAALKERSDLFASEREVVEAFQLEKLRALLVHAGKTVPHYREVFRECGFEPGRMRSVEDIERLPILDKKTIRLAGRGMLSEAVPESALTANASGGSTGSPLQFFVDDRYLKASKLTTPSFDMWTGWRRGEPVALLWGAPTDIARSQVRREKIRLELQNRFLIDAFEVSDETLARAVDQLQRRRPALVIAYASAAYLVARYMKNRGVRLVNPPRAVISSAEVLWPHYRTLIESQFGCKVHNRYGSREVGLMAMECDHGTMHINEADVLVEVEEPDASGVGPLLVTQLNNYGFPFIRYRIGDLGKVGRGDCGCGRALSVLTGLKGRTSDHIVAPDGTIIHGEWFTHLFYEVEGVALFTFRQTGPARYVFEVQRDGGFEAERFDHAVDAARDKLGGSAQVDVVFVERFEASPSGKHRFVINECSEGSDLLSAEGRTNDAELKAVGVRN